MWKVEAQIELEILKWFESEWCMCWKDDLKWTYDEKAWKFRRNNHPFVNNWRSDVVAIIWGLHVSVEVKRPCEMKHFDRPLHDLQKRLFEAQQRNLTKQWMKKFVHAVEQRKFLDWVIKSWWIWFFSSSLKQTKERLKKYWFIIE